MFIYTLRIDAKDVVTVFCTGRTEGAVVVVVVVGGGRKNTRKKSYGYGIAVHVEDVSSTCSAEMGYVEMRVRTTPITANAVHRIDVSGTGN
jgi:hypothetical protein